jgi:hypothetical protein
VWTNNSPLEFRADEGKLAQRENLMTISYFGIVQN